jgi:antitoxin component YwqK of YwqJK toxin-antitoxin module
MKRNVAALAPILLVAFAQSVLAQSAIETALAATVTIEVAGPDGLSHGSGFITSSDGMIITAAHVIEGATSAVVRLQNGEELNVEGVIAIDGPRDFAIVRVAGFDLPTVPLGNADDLSIGQRVIVIGAPIDAALAGTVSDGLLAADRLIDGTRTLQISAPTSPGNSGGPVLTEQGQVIGLVVSGIQVEGAENLNFALPINYVRGQLALAATRTLQPMADLLVTTNAGNTPGLELGNAIPSNEIEEAVLGYLDAAYEVASDMVSEAGIAGMSLEPAFHSFLGDLPEAEQEIVSLELPENEGLLFIGVCDGDCSELDLLVKDGSGNILGEEVDIRDDTPMHGIEGRAAGTIQVEVIMGTCSVEPCYFAVGVFEPIRLPVEDGPFERYYENGQIEEKGSYRDGEYDGPFERYYENGQIEDKGSYRDGEYDGLFERYYENGQIEEKGSYRDGEYDGPFERYYENGQIEGKGSYRDGEFDGPFERYYEDGQIEVKGSYRDGEFDGPFERYYEDGELQGTGFYKNGEACGTWIVDRENVDYEPCSPRG